MTTSWEQVGRGAKATFTWDRISGSTNHWIDVPVFDAQGRGWCLKPQEKTTSAASPESPGLYYHPAFALAHAHQTTNPKRPSACPELRKDDAE